MKVNLLHTTSFSSNEKALLFPLYCFGNQLRERGCSVGFHTTISDRLYDCDVLLLLGKFFNRTWDTPSEVFDFLTQARKRTNRVIWHDSTDSTGTPQFAVLPYVDRYLKAQLLRDRRLYLRRHYGYRLFCDFYHEKFGIEDSETDGHMNTLPAEADLGKIDLLWNSGLSNYSVHRCTGFDRRWFNYRHIFPYPFHYPRTWYPPRAARQRVFSCRIRTDYPRATVSFQRAEVERRLRQIRLLESARKMSRKKYFKEMEASYAVISPFGFGEISLRDFELTICGAACVKQNMDHMDTWPNLWRPGMYVPWRWDFSDFEDIVRSLPNRKEELTQCAENAQQCYRNLLDTAEGHEAICNRFIEKMSF